MKTLDLLMPSTLGVVAFMVVWAAAIIVGVLWARGVL